MRMPPFIPTPTQLPRHQLNNTGFETSSKKEACDWKHIFSNCYGPYFPSNYRVAHTTAAVTCARRHAKSPEGVAFCLPRNNGIEWMEVFAEPDLVVELFDIAAGNARTES